MREFVHLPLFRCFPGFANADNPLRASQEVGDNTSSPSRTIRDLLLNILRYVTGPCNVNAYVGC